MTNMVSQTDERTLPVGVEHQLLLSLEKAGLEKPDAQQVIQSKDNALAKKTVSFIRRNGYEETVSQKICREIMGDNFLGVPEVAEHLGIMPLEENLPEITRIPFDKELLRKCKDTHVLFLVIHHDSKKRPLTFKLLQKMFPDEFRLCPNLADEVFREFCDQEMIPQTQWHLVKKTIVENCLSPQEYLEETLVYLYMILLMYKARGQRLFEDKLHRLDQMIWCPDRLIKVGSSERRFVIKTSYTCATLGSCPDGTKREFLGFAPARLPFYYWNVPGFSEQF